MILSASHRYIERMDSTVSFVLALIALVISALSALAAFLSIRQNAAHFPRPIFHVELTYRPSDDGTHSWMRIEIWNNGNADAQEVSYALMNGSKTVTIGFIETLAPRQRHFDKWQVSPEAVSVEMPNGAVLPIGSGANPKQLVVVVRWHQVPNLGKWREKKFHPNLTTLLD